ncbi:PEP-CTERM sorting domain-containing protein [Planctomycetales bacterium ZRK34]|nr:PEP-CTERM sorting domain-containing protein [Planctomycetales bacterium ZRK34]
MRWMLSACLAAVVGGVFASNSFGVIITENLNGVFDRTIFFFDPMGQSFVAADSTINSIEVVFSVANPGSANEPITAELREGAGLDGNLIATNSLMLPSDLPGSSDAVGPLIDLGFGDVAVTPGATYTFTLAATSTRNAVVYGSTNGYADGEMFHGPDNASEPGPDDDIRFRITSTPEPASLGAMAIGVCLMVRRKRRA